MAFTHLAAASSAAIAVSRVRSTATSPTAAFACRPATPCPGKGGLFVRGGREASPIVAAAGPASVAPVADLDSRPATEKQPIIVIDNYDSFTYNLCQYMGELGLNFVVYRNDELTIEDVKSKNPRGILISPGPGKIIRAPSGVMHGKSSPVFYDEELGKALFNGLPNPFTAGRYHSLVIQKETFPHDALEVTAWTEDGLIMAARHRKYKHIQGVQFHPESINTPEGTRIILNFVRFIEELEKQRS